jgi:hypothetical protein
MASLLVAVCDGSRRTWSIVKHGYLLLFFSLFDLHSHQVVSDREDNMSVTATNLHHGCLFCDIAVWERRHINCNMESDVRRYPKG